MRGMRDENARRCRGCAVYVGTGDRIRKKQTCAQTQRFLQGWCLRGEAVRAIAFIQEARRWEAGCRQSSERPSSQNGIFCGNYSDHSRPVRVWLNARLP